MNLLPSELSAQETNPNVMVRDDSSDFWSGSTFMPHDQPSRTDALVEAVSKRRRDSFIALSLWVSAKVPELSRSTGFQVAFEKFTKLSSEMKREFIDCPSFLVWLKRPLEFPEPSSLHIARVKRDLEVRLAELSRVMVSFEKRALNPDVLRIQGTSVEVARFEVDPLIAGVAPECYRFPSSERQREFEENVAYPLHLFCEMITVALDRIRRAWPAAHKDFLKCVKLIVHAVDANFRSASDSRCEGVIYISTDGFPLIDLEEFLVHEFGHQLVYKLMELDPLFITVPEEKYKLPWSGHERNLFGYFRAFYIYTLLVRYHERVSLRSKVEQSRSSERKTSILKGLIESLPVLEQAEGFTPRGRHLFETLRDEVLQMKSSHSISPGLETVTP